MGDLLRSKGAGIHHRMSGWSPQSLFFWVDSLWSWRVLPLVLLGRPVAQIPSHLARGCELAYAEGASCGGDRRGARCRRPRDTPECCTARGGWCRASGAVFSVVLQGVLLCLRFCTLPGESWLWGDQTAPMPCSCRLVFGCWQVSVSGFISCHLKWPQMPVLCTERYLQCRAVRDSVTKRKLL